MATVSDRFITVLGPRKMEVLSLTAVTTADTVVSQLANPKYGFFVGTTSSGAMTSTPALAFSGRTVTLTSTDLSASTGILVLFGF